MKCKIFWGCVEETRTKFDEWAKGKALTRDVLIHEHVIYSQRLTGGIELMIIVYHPEGQPYE